MLAHTYTNRKCTICSKFQPSEGLEYALINDDTAYMVTGIGTCTDYFLVIPDEYNGLPVTEIGNIYGCNHILSIVLGKNITGMNTSAFDGNYSIIEVYNLSGIDMEWEFPHRKALHSSADEKSILEYSGDYVFMKDEGDYYLLRYLGNEENLTLPATYKDSAYKIHKYAFFNNTSLVNVTIPSGVTYIGMSAFEGCTSLESIEIPETVTEIDSAVFMNCTSLEAIQLPSGIKYIGDSLFSNCVLLESITVPDSVEFIYGYAFAGCTNLKEINIPSTVKELTAGVFSDCTSLTEVQLPTEITYLGFNLFKNCTSLESIEIPVCVVKIERYAFAGCTSLTEIEIPVTVTLIEPAVFEGCTSIERMTIPFVGGSVTNLKTLNHFFSYNPYGTSAVPSSLSSVTITVSNESLSNAFEGRSDITITYTSMQ
jgi:hypothetical protein